MPPEVGKDLIAWCNKCKLVLDHVCVSMKGTRAHRVECKTCRDTHAYRKSEPGSSGRKKSTTRKNDFQKAMEGRDVGTAIPYVMTATFAVDDLIDHKKFGLGVVLEIVNSQMVAVVFENGPKTMLHNRS